MTSWKSVQLEVFYNVLGWTAFISWSISFYPQIALNHRRKSVVGLNFDFALLNFMKQMAYFVYNASLFFSSTVQKQYRKKYHSDEMLPVAINDVAFSIHAVLMSGYTVFQILIYDRGNQKVSKKCMVLLSLVFLAAVVCTFVAIPRCAWFWLVSCLNTMQVVMTIIKYIPQVIFNFQRRTTSGFSIGNVMLDLLGGVSNGVQMVVQSIDQNSWENLFGNLGKVLLALLTIFFDTIFIVQHYVLYPFKKAALPSHHSVVNTEMLRDIEER